MRRIHLISLLSLICLAVIDVGRSIASAFDRGLDHVLSMISPSAKPMFSFDGPALALDAPGSSLDASLLHGLRHEAGVRRRSADRNV